MVRKPGSDRLERTTWEKARAARMAAVGMITVWIVHADAAVWVRGTIRAMTRGSVTGGWAWRHHRKWLRDLVSGAKAKPPATPAE